MGIVKSKPILNRYSKTSRNLTKWTNPYSKLQDPTIDGRSSYTYDRAIQERHLALSFQFLTSTTCRRTSRPILRVSWMENWATRLQWSSSSDKTQIMVNSDERGRCSTVANQPTRTAGESSGITTNDERSYCADARRCGGDERCERAVISKLLRSRRESRPTWKGGESVSACKRDGSHSDNSREREAMCHNRSVSTSRWTIVRHLF